MVVVAIKEDFTDVYYLFCKPGVALEYWDDMTMHHSIFAGTTAQLSERQKHNETIRGDVNTVPFFGCDAIECAQRVNGDS